MVQNFNFLKFAKCWNQFAVISKTRYTADIQRTFFFTLFLHAVKAVHGKKSAGWWMLKENRSEIFSCVVMGFYVRHYFAFITTAVRFYNIVLGSWAECLLLSPFISNWMKWSAVIRVVQYLPGNFFWHDCMSFGISL